MMSATRRSDRLPLRYLCVALAFLLAPVTHADETEGNELKPCASHVGSVGPALSPAKQVRCVLLSYIEATRTGNAQLARSLFHTDARMTGQMDDGEVRAGTPEPFFKVLESHPSASSGPNAYSAYITSVTVQGGIATGTLAERNLYGYNFVDHFHLLKSDGRWQIISKLYNGQATTAGPSSPSPQR
jgi:hypothetical protein